MYSESSVVSKEKGHFIGRKLSGPLQPAAIGYSAWNSHQTGRVAIPNLELIVVKPASTTLAKAAKPGKLKKPLFVNILFKARMIPTCQL
jgi:hypothetical protein